MEDAIAEGFRRIIVKEAVGDRVSGVVAWNLFDMGSKFGDVEPLENVIQYLNNLPEFADTVPTSAAPVAVAVLVQVLVMPLRGPGSSGLRCGVLGQVWLVLRREVGWAHRTMAATVTALSDWRGRIHAGPTNNH